MKRILHALRISAILIFLSANSSLLAQPGVPPNPYCIPTYDPGATPCNQPGLPNAAGNWINDFVNSFNTTGGIVNIVNNNSTCNSQVVTGYGLWNYFYWGCQYYLRTVPGAVITCNIQSGTTYAHGFSVWIDWNNDGIFQNPAELAAWTGVPPANTFISCAFTVPAAQPTGVYRLRVRSYYVTAGNFHDPCNYTYFGEGEDYNVYVNMAPPLGAISVTATSNSTVCTGNTLSLNATYAGTYAPVPTYSWAGPNAFTSTLQAPTISPATTLAAGIYTVVVTNGCNTGSAVTTVSIANPPTVTVNNPTVCSGKNIALTATGGTAYAWSGPLGYSSNVQNPVITNAQVNMSGAYTVIVTSAAGCTNSAVANVSVSPSPTAAITSNTPCVGDFLYLSGSGGGTYSWTGPNGFSSAVQNPTINNVTMAAGGVYSLVVTVGTCTNIATLPVTINPLPTPTATSNSPICTGQPINFSGAGGTTYTWTGPGGFTSNAQFPSIAVAQASNAGIYTLAVTNNNGCINTTTTNVVISPLPVIVVNNPTVCANSNLSLTATGGTAYAWSGPLGYTSNQQNPVITNAQINMSGNYTVLVTSAAGCTNTAVANVTVLTLPTPAITSNTPCVGGTLTLNGSGGGTYSWTGPNGFSSAVQNPVINNVTMPAAGVYSLIVTVGTCTNIATLPITINPLPTPTATSNSPVCTGQPINLSGAGGTTYTWTGPGGFTSNAQFPSIAVAQASNAGIYTLAVTNNNGCINTTTTNVVISPLPVIVVNNPTVCANSNLSLTATGGTAYAWSGPLGYTSNQQNPVITNAQINMSGNYTVLVTSAAGCTNTAVANVTVLTLPTPAITSNTPCVGGTLTLNGSGGGTYSWTGPNGFSSAVQNPVINNVTMPAAGVYSLIVTVGTCTNVATLPITINPLPTPTATSNSPVCVNQPINFTGAGGTTYTWTGPGGYTSNAQNPSIAAAQATNAGVYTLQVTNANGCTNSVTTNVVINALPVIAVNNPTVCLNQNIGLTATGGTAYAWSGPLGYTSNQQNPTITNAQLNMSGAYTVTVTSAAGCTNIAVANVTVITLPNPVITSNAPVCVGATLSFTATGGATYSWSGPNGFASALQYPNIPNVTMAANGVYTLIATAGTCSNSVTANIVINALPTPTATSNSPVCVNQPINFTGAGGTTYTWTGPGGYTSNTQNPVIALAQATNAGVYTLQVSNANGCTNSITTNVVINALPVIAVNNPTVCANTSISLTATGGTAYAWSGPLGYTSTQQNPVITNAQLNMSGAYSVVVTSAAGCTDIAVANVTVITLPMPVIASNTPCAGATLSFTGSGGATYSWSGPNGFSSGFQNPTIPNVTMAAGGTYTLIVTAGTCSNSTTALVTINPLPTPTITSNSPVCVNQPINFTGAGGTTYTWTGPGGYTSNTQNPVIALAQATNAGTYTLSVTNANGCTNSISSNVVVNPLPVIAVNNPTVCLNQNIGLTATGGTAYAWSGPLGYASAVQNPVITNAQLNMTGGYSVVVTSAAGCTDVAVANVTIITLPTPAIVSNTPCVGATLSFTGSGGATYSWSGPNGFASALQNPNIPNVTLAAGGTYTLIVTAGTCSNSTTALVTINPLPTPTITSNSPVCVNQPINFTGAGGTTYTWTGPGGYTSNTQNPVIALAQATNAGTYTLAVTDANGCSNSVSSNVVVNPLPVIAVNNPTVCLNQNISLTATGGTAYAWSGPLGYTSNIQNPVITNAQLGMTGGYTVTVTTAFGCTNTAVANVTVLSLPSPAIVSNTPCVGATLSFTGSGGVTYSWSGPNGFASALQNPNIPNVTLAAGGTYTLIVTAGTCSNSTTGLVTINPLPTPTITSNSPACVNQPINFTGAGGTTYTWTGPGAYNSVMQNPTIALAQATNAGTYTLTVGDINACTNSITTNVVVNPLPVIVVNNPTVCLNQNIGLTATGGTAYAWSGPAGYTANVQNPFITNAQLNMNGAYTVTVTTAFGCTNTAVANVTVLPLPTPAIASNTPCVGGTLNLTGSGGTTYNWTGPNAFVSAAQNPNIPNVTLAAGGTYSLTVTTGICSNTTTALITINPLPTPTITSNSPVCLNQPINFTGAGGTTYTWTGPGAYNSPLQNPTIASAQATNAGMYTLSVTDANGCSNSTSQNVVVNPLPAVSAAGSTVCFNTVISLSSGGASTYTWSGPNTYTSNAQNPNIPFATLNMTGAYTVTGTSALGCTNSAVANVSVIALPIPAIVSNTPCVGATLTFTGSGGSTYSWTGPNGFTSNQQNPSVTNVSLLANGMYSLVVTALSCSNITTASVTINPLPSPTITSNSPVCDQQTLHFYAGGGSVYNWTGPNGYTGSGANISIPLAGNTLAGTYTLNLTDVNGCSNTKTTSVIVNPLPIIAAMGSTLCATKTISLSATGGTAYTWVGPVGFTSNNASELIPNSSLSQQGQYSVTVTDINGCTSTSMTNVQINPIPSPTVSSNSPICEHDTLSLQSSALTGNTFSWMGPNGFSAIMKNPKIADALGVNAGTYTVTITDNIGCSATALLNVYINTLPIVSVSSNKTKGCVPVCVDFNPQSTGTLQSCYWDFGDGSTGTGLNINKCYNKSGKFTVNTTFSDINGCQNTATFAVEAYPIPVADFNYASAKPIINEQVEFTDASYGATITGWLWNFSHLPHHPVFKPQTTLTYDNAGNYAIALIVTSDKGCKDTAVKAITIGDDFALYVPDVFTPNGDGLNDIFSPKGFGIVKYEMNIFDRWGERVFTTTDFNQGWDGSFTRRHEDEIKQDIYIWKVKVTNVFGKEQEFAGKVTVIR